jgi:hypothetical protein
VSSVSATTGTSDRNGGLVALGVVLIIIGILAAVAGIMYLSMTEANIPAFLPGHVTTGKDATVHHTLRGIGGIVVAVILFIAAGFTFRRPKVNSAQS